MKSIHSDGHRPRLHNGSSAMVPRSLSAAVIVVLLCVAMLGGPVIAHASPFLDVPTGHWAYGALEQLSAASLIDGYSPGFFTGARRLTRYEMALSVAGALTRLRDDGTRLTAGEHYDLEQLISDFNARVTEAPLTAADVELLQAVVVEFQDELKMLGYTVALPRGVTAANVSPDSPPGFTGATHQLDGSIDWVARQRLLMGRDRGNGDLAAANGHASANGAADDAAGSSGRAAAALWLQTGAAEATVALGRIGSTVLFTEGHVSTGQVHAWERKTVPLLDGSIHLSENVLPGAILSGAAARQRLLPFWPGTETLMGVDGVEVTPYLSLAGERAQRYSLQVDAGATAVRATVALGEDVSLAGRIRTVEPGFEAADGDAIGLGLTVRLGDVLLSTGRDIVQRPEDDDVEHVTSWSLEYSLTEQAQVRAGWQTVRDTRSRASVDLNVPVPQGALHLGLAYEGAREPGSPGISMTTLTIAGLDVRVWDNAEARAAFSLRDFGDKSERTTSLGLRYTLSPEAALLLGYKFIDFTDEVDEDRAQNVTTAEFSIRF